MTDNSRYNYATKKSSGRRNHFIRRNMMKWYEGARSNQEIGKIRQSVLERRQNCLCGWKNLCTKSEACLISI